LGFPLLTISFADRYPLWKNPKNAEFAVIISPLIAAYRVRAPLPCRPIFLKTKRKVARHCEVSETSEDLSTQDYVEIYSPADLAAH
jgi:hypothetical protein